MATARAEFFSSPPLEVRSAPPKVSSIVEQDPQKFFQLGLSRLEHAYVGAHRAFSAKEQHTVDLLIERLEGLQEAKDSQEKRDKLGKLHQDVNTQLLEHMSGKDEEKFLSPIEIDAVEATRLIVESHMAGSVLAPVDTYNRFRELLNPTAQHLRDPFDNGNIRPRRSQTTEAHPHVVYNERGDAFEDDGTGRQKRAQPGFVSVEGSDLVRRWNSPLPEGTVIDFSGLMNKLKDPASLNSFTNDKKERVPFSSKLPDSHK